MKKSIIIVAVLVVILSLIAAAMLYIRTALAPVNTEIGVANTRIIISEGESVTTIAKDLKDHGLIRDPHVFRWYVELTGARAKLQAGAYAISPALSTPQIVQQLIDGKSTEFNVLIPPGLTLAELRNTLIKYGFTEADIDQAFAGSYPGVTADRPAGQSLEGYLYPETYRVGIAATATDLVSQATAELDRAITPAMRQSYAAKGLTVYQAITLASMVEKETGDPGDQPQVAQVFLKRLSIGMELGSDVTFIYAAKQLGVEPRVNLDSPYNTRRYKGLPPGPISNVSLTALQAVANPAPGDYLYFVAGDDGTTYFAHTFEEHERNIAAYCTTLCQ